MPAKKRSRIDRAHSSNQPVPESDDTDTDRDTAPRRDANVVRRSLFEPHGLEQARIRNDPVYRRDMDTMMTLFPGENDHDVAEMARAVAHLQEELRMSENKVSTMEFTIQDLEENIRELRDRLANPTDSVYAEDAPDIWDDVLDQPVTAKDELKKRIDRLAAERDDTIRKQRENVAHIMAVNDTLRHQLGEAMRKVARLSEQAATVATTGGDAAMGDGSDTGGDPRLADVRVPSGAPVTDADSDLNRRVAALHERDALAMAQAQIRELQQALQHTQTVGEQAIQVAQFHQTVAEQKANEAEGHRQNAQVIADAYHERVKKVAEYDEYLAETERQLTAAHEEVMKLRTELETTRRRGGGEGLLAGWNPDDDGSGSSSGAPAPMGPPPPRRAPDVTDQLNRVNRNTMEEMERDMRSRILNERDDAFIGLARERLRIENNAELTDLLERERANQRAAIDRERAIQDEAIRKYETTLNQLERDYERHKAEFVRERDRMIEEQKTDAQARRTQEADALKRRLEQRRDDFHLFTGYEVDRYRTIKEADVNIQKALLAAQEKAKEEIRKARENAAKEAEEATAVAMKALEQKERDLQGRVEAMKATLERERKQHTERTEEQGNRIRELNEQRTLMEARLRELEQKGEREAAQRMREAIDRLTQEQQSERERITKEWSEDLMGTVRGANTPTVLKTLVNFRRQQNFLANVREEIRRRREKEAAKKQVATGGGGGGGPPGGDGDDDAPPDDGPPAPRTPPPKGPPSRPPSDAGSARGSDGGRRTPKPAAAPEEVDMLADFNMDDILDRPLHELYESPRPQITTPAVPKPAPPPAVELLPAPQPKKGKSKKKGGLGALLTTTDPTEDIPPVVATSTTTGAPMNIYGLNSVARMELDESPLLPLKNWPHGTSLTDDPEQRKISRHLRDQRNELVDPNYEMGSDTSKVLSELGTVAEAQDSVFGKPQLPHLAALGRTGPGRPKELAQNESGDWYMVNKNVVQGRDWTQTKKDLARGTPYKEDDYWDDRDLVWVTTNVKNDRGVFQSRLTTWGEFQRLKDTPGYLIWDQDRGRYVVHNNKIVYQGERGKVSQFIHYPGLFWNAGTKNMILKHIDTKRDGRGRGARADGQYSISQEEATQLFKRVYRQNPPARAAEMMLWAERRVAENQPAIEARKQARREKRLARLKQLAENRAKWEQKQAELKAITEKKERLERIVQHITTLTEEMRPTADEWHLTGELEEMDEEERVVNDAYLVRLQQEREEKDREIRRLKHILYTEDPSYLRHVNDPDWVPSGEPIPERRPLDPTEATSSAAVLLPEGMTMGTRRPSPPASNASAPRASTPKASSMVSSDDSLLNEVIQEEFREAEPAINVDQLDQLPVVTDGGDVAIGDLPRDIMDIPKVQQERVYTRIFATMEAAGLGNRSQQVRPTPGRPTPTFPGDDESTEEGARYPRVPVELGLPDMFSGNLDLVHGVGRSRVPDSYYEDQNQFVQGAARETGGRVTPVRGHASSSRAELRQYRQLLHGASLEAAHRHFQEHYPAGSKLR